VQRARHEARSRSDELQHEMDQHSRAQALQERTVSAMLDTAQIGMAVIDPDGRIQRANAAFAELAGTTSEALRLKVIDDVLVDAERPAPQRFTRLMQEASDDLVHQSMRLRNSDGRVTPALVTLSVLRGEAGRAVAAVCAVHDLSENLRRRQVEQVLGNVMELSRGETRPGGLASTPSEPGPAAQRVLCISGHAELPEQLRTALHDRSHITLLSAAGGPEGLLLARSQGPDCVLLDLDLPDADGLALMARLTQEGLPVIALSQNLRPARIDEAFAAGARAYLTMPLEARELLAVLDDLG
jgi:PAS domain S-box-containing protein